MKFERMSSWHEVSDCGRYTVCAAKVNDRFVFQAWRRPAAFEVVATLLGTSTDAQVARDLCVEAAGKVAA